VVADLVGTATGRQHRNDASRGVTGGPAGNARLAAWTGLVLLVLLAAEGATLLSLGRLISVHVFLGALVVPPVLFKSATVSWRVARYYTGDPDYVRSGPPPLLLRVLGPLVVLTSLAVLGTGLLLSVQGSAGRRSFAGTGLSMLTLHKLTFVLWFAAMALHVLTRTVPALRIVSGAADTPRAEVRGGGWRGLALVLSLVVGVAVGALVLHASSWWTSAG
jgi:hypothetical protein